MYIGSAIRDIRLSRGFSQERLAEETGLAQNVISRIERDMHKPSDDTLGRLAKALDVETDVFYYLAIIGRSEKSKLDSVRSKIAPVIKEELRKLFSID
jgi:transcriptional regulator with XRE-family HTH domain